jgi:cell division protein FtsX
MSILASDRRFHVASVTTGATAAVIEEARRRQRRRRLMAASAAGVALVAGAVLLGQQHFGHAGRIPIATNDQSVSGQPSITLYLRRDASPTAIRSTIASVSHEQGVARVTFVSRDEALRILKRRYPNLLSKITYNPLTDAIDVRLTTDQVRSSIVPQLNRLRIVEHITYRATNRGRW